MRSKILKALLFLFVFLLTLSMSACSPASPGPYLFLGIEQIGVGENVIYARTTQYCIYEVECEDGAIIHAYYVSNDQGKTWHGVDLPSIQMEKFEIEADRHVAMCLISDSEHCYRINGEENVEVSNDGGVRWHVDWQIPDGRRLYMERYFSGRALSLTPYDLEIIETGNDHLVVVAMGYEGVMVRSADGVWSRYAVDTLAPTPYQAETLSNALSALMYFEMPWMILIAAAAFLLLTFSAWITFFVRSERIARRTMLLSLLPVLFALVLVAAYYFLALLFIKIEGLQGMRSFLLSNFFFVIKMIQLYIIISPLLTYVIAWVMMVTYSLDAKFSFASFLLSTFLPLLLAIFILLPYVLWALGTISIYETAQTWAVYMGGVSLLLALFIEIRMTALSVGTKRKEVSI